MDHTEIQTRINAIPQIMGAKGLVSPDARFELRANMQCHVMLTWHDKPGGFVWDECRTFPADSVEHAFDAALAFIASMPTIEETNFKRFAAALGEAIELGQKAGIDVKFVNPLVEAMERLSANIITHQPEVEA